jgi:hypothetical protein
MASINQLTHNSSSPMQSPASSNIRHPSQTADASKPSAIEKRVAQLQQNTISLAQDFMGFFTQQLFGDDAKGMKISFDQVEVSASSSASASSLISQDINSTSSAAMFSLNDSSSFVGRGTLTTADGKQFEFELTVNYRSSQQASFVHNSNNNTNPTQPLFNGTADDLREHFTSEPVKLPFKLEQDDALQGLGDMALKLLNLNGGDRYFDWYGNNPNKIDQQA